MKIMYLLKILTGLRKNANDFLGGWFAKENISREYFAHQLFDCEQFTRITHTFLF